MGLKEVSSKKHHLDNRESSSLGSQRNQNGQLNSNLLEKEDTQPQHEGKCQHIEKKVSFYHESEPGDFVPEDIDKYEEDKLLRVSEVK